MATKIDQYSVYTVVEWSANTRYWVMVGRAYFRGVVGTLDVELDAIPVNGRLTISGDMHKPMGQGHDGGGLPVPLAVRRDDAAVGVAVLLHHGNIEANLVVSSMPADGKFQILTVE